MACVCSRESFQNILLCHDILTNQRSQKPKGFCFLKVCACPDHNIKSFTVWHKIWESRIVIEMSGIHFLVVI